MRWWLRVQMAFSVMPVVNFTLLSVSASPVIADWTGVQRKLIVLFAPVVGVLGLALLGLVMDRMGWTARQEREYGARSSLWRELFARLDRIEGRLDDKAGR